jgi:hypothetical protein
MHGVGLAPELAPGVGETASGFIVYFETASGCNIKMDTILSILILHLA